jgi:hypothetical protein
MPTVPLTAVLTNRQVFLPDTVYRQMLKSCILEQISKKYVQAVRITAEYVTLVNLTAFHMRRTPPCVTLIQTT